MQDALEKRKKGVLHVLSQLSTPIHKGADFLFVPGKPTPNGGLHLGHIAGPFLKMDVVARYLKMRGNSAKFILGTDDHESHVLFKASQTGEAPEEVARSFHIAIRRDLESLDIIPDEVIHPLDSQWNALYMRWHTHVMRELIDSGHTVVREESVLYSPGAGRFVTGCWLLGECPECSTPSAGYVCENCGIVFSPQSLVQPSDRLGHTDLKQRTLKTIFLKVPDPKKIFEIMEKMHIADNHQRTIARSIQREGAYLRLTHSSDWGIPWPVETNQESVLFTYTVGQFAYAMMCGEVYSDITGKPNPFEGTCDTITVDGGGIDNIFWKLVSNIGIHTAIPSLKSYDRVFVNYFCHLEGEKFSTSRGHVIWVNDIAKRLPSDWVRYYLACLSPDKEITDFRIQDFVSRVNKKIGKMYNVAQRCCNTIGTMTVSLPDSEWVRRLEELMTQQASALDPMTGSVDMLEAVRCLDDWSTDERLIAKTDHVYWWLKAMSLLSYAIMPNWGKAIWKAFGYDKDPSFTAFSETRRFHPVPLPQFNEVNFKDIEECFIRGYISHIQ